MDMTVILNQLKGFFSGLFKGRAKEEKSPKKPSWMGEGSKGFLSQDTQEFFKDFQSKKNTMKPQAADDDLSKVIDDALDTAPPTKEAGLYAPAPKKKPRS